MDKNEPDTTEANRRDTPRIGMGEKVTVCFDDDTIIGPGQNISAQGVFFVADVSLRVTVRIEGVEAEIPAELVRVQSMGEGQLGIAVRFIEPQDQLSND